MLAFLAEMGFLMRFGQALFLSPERRFRHDAERMVQTVHDRGPGSEDGTQPFERCKTQE